VINDIQRIGEINQRIDAIAGCIFELYFALSSPKRYSPESDWPAYYTPDYFGMFMKEPVS
jgi:hypothetical protein